jgi:hypothetical protein
MRENVDAWSARQSDEPGRSEAIRRLVELGLEERQLRKRRLLKGPKEFRDIRSNVKTTR